MKLFEMRNSKNIIGVVSFILMFGSAFAQNNCGSAVTVTDLTGTNCTTSAPSNTNALAPGTCEEGTNDTWFQFTAQGTSADITVSNNANGWRPEFLVISGTPANNCGGFVEESCNDANGNYTSLNNPAVTPLTIGETYWIVVSSGNNSSNGTITVCVDNPAAGPCQDNEDCSNPLAVALNGPGNAAACVTDCNTSASAGPDFTGTNCYDLPNATVWYTITTGATTTTLDIGLTSGALSDPEYTLFTTDCSLFTIFDCDEGTAGVAGNTGITVTPNTTYVIAVSDATGDEGSFDLCITEHEPATGGCVDNQDCSTPETLTLNASGGAALCITDCNTGASVGPDFTGNNCQDLPNATVWYTFTTDANAATLDIDLSSVSDLSEPEFSLFTTTDCSFFTTIFCNEGTGGSAVSTGIGISSNTTYILAVSDATADEGNFDLCITQNPDNSACNTDNTLAVTATSMGSPLTGPFAPGETVSFCYTINNYITGLPSDPQGCNYLQGIVPTFGDCWTNASFDGQGMPVAVTTALTTIGVLDYNPPAPSCEGDPAGTWAWYGAGSVQYNLSNANPLGLTAGDDVGAGWFFTTSYSSFTGACNAGGNDPNNSYGDNDFVQCNDISGWQVCFDLVVKSSTACGLGETDCTVSVKTFADGEIGVWSNIGCTADIPNTMPTAINCALPVELGSLAGTYVDKSVIIDWSTISENNTSHFLVYHLTHLGEQVEVGYIDAVGFSEQEVDYRFIHDSPHPGVNYYNLKAVDFDGSVKDHGHVAVNAKYGFVQFDSESKEIVLTYESDVEIYGMDGTLIKTSLGALRIPFEETGVFMVRDMASGVMERIVAH